VPQQPIINLSLDEVKKVKDFADLHKLDRFKKIILMECGPESFKSALNPISAKEIADKLTKEDSELAIILSSSKKIDNINPQIIDASILDFRSNAELTKYCTLFVGCSSGISWLTTTNWAKPLPKVIVINPHNHYYNSMIYDHLYAKLPIDNIIELKENKNTAVELTECISVILYDSFEKGKKQFHKALKLVNFTFLNEIMHINKHNGNHKELFKVISNIIKRNGWRKKPILYFISYFFKLPRYFYKYKKK
jgi:hypothetical protein